MTENRFTYENHKVKDNLTGEINSSNRVSVNVFNKLNDENKRLKQQIQQAIDDIWLLQSFITYKGYSPQDLKEWEDLKKELSE